MKSCNLCHATMKKPKGYSAKQWDTAKFCSTTCQHLSRRGEKHIGYKVRKDATKWIEKACKCGTKYKTSQNIVNANRGKYCSKKCVSKYAVLVGEEHPNWKDDVGYTALHSWVRRQLGKPMKCEYCGFKSDNPRKIHWANKSQEYKRDTNDWLRLCVKCHHNYDNIHKKIWESRRLKNV